MNTHHTPGPWRADYNAEGDWEIHASTEQSEFSFWISTAHAEVSKEEAQANARLIASAPELLDALQTILALSTPVQTLPWEKTPVVNFAQHMDAIAAHARAAIAKATQP